MLSKELRDLRELGRGAAGELPPHLAGLPECLQKYAPLFAEARDQDDSRFTSAA